MAAAMGTTNQDGHLVPNYSHHVPQRGRHSCGSEGKKLMRSWEQKGTLILLVCECGEKLEKGFLCCNVWLLELMIKRKRNLLLDSICETTHILMIPYLSQCHNTILLFTRGGQSTQFHYLSESIDTAGQILLHYK